MSGPGGTGGLFHTGAYAAHKVPESLFMRLFAGDNSNLPPGFRMSNRALRKWVDDISESCSSEGVPLMLAVEDEDTYDIEVDEQIVIRYLQSIDAAVLPAVVARIQASVLSFGVSAGAAGAAAASGPAPAPAFASSAPAPAAATDAERTAEMFTSIKSIIERAGGTVYFGDTPYQVITNGKFDPVVVRLLFSKFGTDLLPVKITEYIRERTGPEFTIKVSDDDVVVIREDGSFELNMIYEWIDSEGVRVNVDLVQLIQDIVDADGNYQGRKLYADGKIYAGALAELVTSAGAQFDTSDLIATSQVDIETVYRTMKTTLTSRADLGFSVSEAQWGEEPTTQNFELILNRLNTFLNTLGMYTRDAYAPYKIAVPQLPDVELNVLEIMKNLPEILNAFGAMRSFYIGATVIVNQLFAPSTETPTPGTFDHLRYLIEQINRLNNVQIWAGYKFAPVCDQLQNPNVPIDVDAMLPRVSMDGLDAALQPYRNFLSELKVCRETKRVFREIWETTDEQDARKAISLKYINSLLPEDKRVTDLSFLIDSYKEPQNAEIDRLKQALSGAADEKERALSELRQACTNEIAAAMQSRDAQVASIQSTCNGQIQSRDAEIASLKAVEQQLTSRIAALEADLNTIRSTPEGQLDARFKRARATLIQRAKEVDVSQESLRQVSNMLNQLQYERRDQVLQQVMRAKPVTPGDFRFKAAVLHSFDEKDKAEAQNTLLELREQAEAKLKEAVDKAREPVNTFVKSRGNIRDVYNTKQQELLIAALSALKDACDYYVVIMDDIVQEFDRGFQRYGDFKALLDTINLKVTGNSFAANPYHDDPINALEHLYAEARIINANAEAADRRRLEEEAAAAQAAQAAQAQQQPVSTAPTETAVASQALQAMNLIKTRSEQAQQELVQIREMQYMFNGKPYTTKSAIEFKAFMDRTNKSLTDLQTFLNFYRSIESPEIQQLNNIATALDGIVRSNISAFEKLTSTVRSMRFDDSDYNALVGYSEAVAVLFPEDAQFVQKVLEALYSKYAEHLETCNKQLIRERTVCLIEAMHMIRGLEYKLHVPTLQTVSAPILERMKLDFVGLYRRQVQEFRSDANRPNLANVDVFDSSLNEMRSYFEEHAQSTTTASNDQIEAVLWPEKAKKSEFYEALREMPTNNLQTVYDSWDDDKQSRFRSLVTRFVVCSEERFIDCLRNEREPISRAIANIDTEHEQKINAMRSASLDDATAKAFLDGLESRLPNKSDQAEYVDNYFPALADYLVEGETRKQRILAVLALVLKLRNIVKNGEKNQETTDAIKRIKLKIKREAKGDKGLLRQVDAFLTGYQYGDVIQGSDGQDITTYAAAVANLDAIERVHAAETPTLSVLQYFSDLSNGTTYTESLDKSQQKEVIQELLRTDGPTFAKLVGQDVDKDFEDPASRVQTISVFLGIDPVEWYKDVNLPRVPFPKTFQGAIGWGDDLLNYYLLQKHQRSFDGIPIEVKALILLPHMISDAHSKSFVDLVLQRIREKEGGRDTLRYLYNLKFTATTEDDDDRIILKLMKGDPEFDPSKPRAKRGEFVEASE